MDKRRKTKGGEEEGLDEPIVEINNLQTCRGTQYEKDCGGCVKARVYDVRT